MCIFTHFAAGALAGGATGNSYLAAPAGFASHALLDMIPHYDHPDWRLELAGGLLSLLLLLLMPFGTAPAIVGGVFGVVPDLENLFQKLGKMRRDQFVYPTHTGLLPHGRTLSPRSIVWQFAIFISCYFLLSLLAPGQAQAATPSVVMGKPLVTVLQSGDSRTVIRVDFPVQTAPVNWAAVDLASVQWALPGFIDETEQGSVTEPKILPPRMSLRLAVPTRHPVTWELQDVRWWREPPSGTPTGEIVQFSSPVVSRSVPLTGTELPLALDGGVLRSVTIAVNHIADRDLRRVLTASAALVAGDKEAPWREAVPSGLLNPDLFARLSLGGHRRALERSEQRIKLIAADPFQLTSHWLKFELTETGIYRLTGQDLSVYGVNTTDVDPTKLRVFRGGGMPLAANPELPDSLQAEAIGLNEVAIEVLDGGDGEWNLDDEIRFYGVGASVWLDRLTGGGERLEHYDHPYTAQAVYWLSWENDLTVSPLPGSPRRIAVVDAPATGGQQENTVQLRLHREEQFVDTAGLVADNWVWDNAIFSSRAESFRVRPPVPGARTRFQVDIRGVYNSFAYFWFQAGAHLNDDVANAASVRFNYAGQNDSLRVRVSGISATLVDGINRITRENQSTDTPLRPLALDSYDILYWTALALTPDWGQISFAHWGDQVALAGTPVDLNLSAVGLGTVLMWDVTDPQSATSLRGATDGAGHLTYGLLRDPDTDRHFVAALESDFMAPVSGQRVFPSALRSAETNFDYVVVHAAPFTAAANDLAAFRSQVLPGVSNPRASAVSVGDIYDNFSGGQKDPLAIRNYLKWVFDQSAHRLRYVCFLGNASRDYRNYRNRTPLVDLYDLVSTQVRTTFPVAAPALSIRLAYASDDGLVSFDAAPPGDYDFPDLATGRLPALSVNEARGMVDRALAYADRPETGLWRNRVLMTADDVVRPESYPEPRNGEFAHTLQAEIISNELLPLSLDVRKAYGVDYDFPPGSMVKPAMRADINSEISSGTTIFYYVGHGAEDNLADEQIFQSRDIPNLTNGLRRPLFVAFSCDVGIFDSPTRRSMAEQFLQYESGGSIAAICASQVSFISWNNAASSAFFRHLYPGLHIDPSRSVAEALRLAKADMVLSPNYRTNSQRYNYFGDPAMVLPNPVDDLAFSPASLDTLHAASRQTVVMTAGAGGAVMSGATYRLQVQESSWHPRFPYTSTLAETSFVEPGAVVFKGSGSVGTGDLIVPFRAPIQLHYGETARIRIILETANGDHVAAAELPAVRSGSIATDDVFGPTIQLAFPNNRYRVRAGDRLTAVLTDTSGIAILGNSPANSLLLELDDTGFMTDLTSSFAYAPNSYTSGSVLFSLPADLPLGRHIAALHASDALGNVGSDTLGFEIVPAGVVAIHAVTLFPNPTPGYCRLLFELSDPMEVDWDIFSLAGSRVRRISGSLSAGAQVLEWDGRDSENSEIANGTYFYVLRGRSNNADGRELRKTGKLVMMR